MSDDPCATAARPFHGGQCACDDCMSYDLTTTGYGTSMHYPYCKDRSCTGCLPPRTIGPCLFATMDWYCILRTGHDGPHRSEDLS